MKLRIHGDNIVECERAWTKIKCSLACSDLVYQSANNSIVAPCFITTSQSLDKKISVQYFPGFNRWEPDILEYIRARGSILREAVDAIISVLDDNDDIEIPILAIEFCGALAAGNQAWQRCGRAYGLAASGIPYIYINELGGFELTALRKEKAVRLPNPVVPFSYLTLTSTSQTFNLPLFELNRAATPDHIEDFTDIIAGIELSELIRALILNVKTDKPVQSLSSKTLKLVNLLSENRKKTDTFKPPLWENWLKLLPSEDQAINFIKDKSLKWKKTAYIKSLTKTAGYIIKQASEFGIGVGASELPICIIPKEKRKNFAQLIFSQHTNLSSEFKNWLSKETDLVICWIMGFKPRGDDARPDRGVTPLARMLLGNRVELLTFVYGPAPKTSWQTLINDPVKLAKQNGLWEAILNLSDAILIDSKTDKNITQKGYISSHWIQHKEKLPPKTLKLSAVNPKPRSCNENDVDTIVHTLMTFQNGDVFEGMCNPPGGDWSGISILDNGKELRWLSLPRVGNKKSKRPDHVFEIFKLTDKPVILSVESKDLLKKVENGIGARLTKYTKHLVSSQASAEREHGQLNWNRSKCSINISNYIFASAVCFLTTNDADMKDAAKRTKADIIIGIKIINDGAMGEILLLGINSLGTNLALFILKKIKSSPFPLKGRLV